MTLSTNCAKILQILCIQQTPPMKAISLCQSKETVYAIHITKHHFTTDISLTLSLHL